VIRGDTPLRSIHYLGSDLIEEVELEHRARSLVERAVQALPPARGYFGVDILLADDASGASDRIVEINPRLTSSYAVVRKVCSSSLALGMLEPWRTLGIRRSQRYNAESARDD
jgi:predicted ATP-grasp superfamily ATP-dependent carboligase